MIKKFLIKKYGNYITEELLTKNNEVVIDNIANFENNQQNKVIELLKELNASLGNDLIPLNFFNTKIEWGVDFSSWIGEFNNGKDFMFIGSEPHINVNYQLVYDFGNIKGKTLTEIAKTHYERDDIWYNLTNIFVDKLNDENITNFLEKCYITDLCHIVPKKCGKVDDITKKLSITKNMWNKFRTAIAEKFLLEEIKIVNPKYVILHGANARDFFNEKLGVKYEEQHKINEKHFIRVGKIDKYKVIAIPHLKGSVLNEIWKNKEHPEIPKRAKEILKNIVN